ncbi:hypothetical protein EYC84_004625 [Monilinia fructicola]|uniref:Uncharacterized protein n=1 Tax=Monilinia fructicola TaxID=38448 RepID=A0A5M9K620_MONFR|nr:hypothetical protein EYC84_004625 [Monilinia fructicola]
MNHPGSLSTVFMDRPKVPPQQPIRQPEIYIHHHRYPFIHRQSINLHQVKHFLPWAFVKIEIHQTPR